MCDLVSGLGLGIQAGGVITNFITGYNQSKDYASYVTAMSQSALANYTQQVNTVNTRYRQEAEASAAEQQEIAIQNMRAKATAQASAATGGVQGSSIESLYGDYDRATAVSNYTAARNLQMKNIQYNNALDAYRINALNSVYSLSYSTGTNPYTSLLSGIGGLFTSYSNWYKTGDKSANYR